MVTKQRITLYSADAAIRKAIRDAFEGVGYDVLEITDASKAERPDINEQRQEGTIGRLRLPDRVDAVVSRTGLNSKSEGLAASLALKQSRNDVYVYVLPEAMDALRAKLDRLGDIVIAGADQAK
jgi:DNA-binding response OmpR family regulator